MAVERKLDLIWVEAAHLENDFEDKEMGGEEEYKEAWGKMKSADGVVVPGGFGTRLVIVCLYSYLVVHVMYLYLIILPHPQRIPWKGAGCKILPRELDPISRHLLRLPGHGC